jgi:hypothetical protein
MMAMKSQCALILLFALMLLSIHVESQVGRQKRDLYYESAYQPRGWFFAPGLTWMWPNDGSRTDTRISNREQLNDTLYSGVFRAGGRPGLYLEAGRHRFVENYFFIQHMDFGAHFKMLRGKEDFEGVVKDANQLLPVSNKGRFSESFAGLFVNVSNVMQLSDRSWVHHSFGLNAEYRILSNRKYEGPSGGMPHVFPGSFQGQLHYKLAIGWKADPGLYVLMALETPVLNIYPFDDGKSTVPYFASRYRPFILTLRVMFLDKTKSKSCENQPGTKSTDLDKENPGRHGSNDLFGRDAKMKGKQKRRRKA